MASQPDTLLLSLPVLPAADGRSCVACCVRVGAGRDRLQRDLLRNTRRFARTQMAGHQPGRLKALRYHLADGGWVTYFLAGVLAPLTFGLSLLLWRRWFYTACPYAGFLDERNETPGCLIHPLRQSGGSDRRRTEPWYLIPWLTCDFGYQCPAFTASQTAWNNGQDWYDVTARREAMRERGRERDVASHRLAATRRGARCGFRILDCGLC